MSEIFKGIRIPKEQDQWLERRGYNFSAWVRTKIEQEMQEQAEFEKFQARQKAVRVLDKNSAEGGICELNQIPDPFGVGFDSL